jgi:glycosyl transferase family 25
MSSTGDDDTICLVISLRRSGERRAAIRTALDALGIAFRFVDAVDARDGIDPALVDRDGIRRRMGREMSDGEVACALSHAKAYEVFLASPARHALIFEDDAIPTPDLKRFLDAGLIATAPMLLFYHHNARVFRRSGRVLFGAVRAFRLALPCFGAVAYAIDRASATALLGAARPVRGVADWPVDISDLGAEVTLPMLVEHPPAGPGQSLLTASRSRKSRRGIARLLGIAYMRRKWRKVIARKVS